MPELRGRSATCSRTSRPDEISGNGGLVPGRTANANMSKSSELNRVSLMGGLKSLPATWKSS
jgi:hypothetical protein